MPGIGRELRSFLHADLTGIFVSSVYLWIRALRRVAGHRLWIMNLEDILYWIGTAVYIFVQIYHTSDGIIRWYFVLGAAAGVCQMAFFYFGIRRLYRKRCREKYKKTGKSIDKSR